MARESGRGVLLAAEAVEGPHEDAGSGATRDLLGPVGGGRVHDDDALVRESDRRESVRKAILLVARDERDAQEGLFGGRHGAEV